MPTLILLIFVFVLSGSASAQEKEAVYACLEKIPGHKAISEPQELLTFALDKESQVVAGSMDLKGFVCLVTRRQGKPYVLDLQTGPEMGILKDAKLLRGKSDTFLQTEQILRGERDEELDYHMVYKITPEKLYKALKIPRHRELAVGGYRYLEENDLAYDDGQLTITQRQKILTQKENQTPIALYEADRRFKMTYSEDYRSFISGTALCVKNIGNGWCKEKERVGYRINSLIAEGEGMAFQLINKRRETRTITNADDMTLVKPEEASPSAQP